MTSLGRGRGWAHSKNVPLPRPGRPVSPKDIDCTTLINQINRIENHGCTSEKISVIQTIIMEKAQNGSLKAVIEKLYKHGVNDKDFGRKLVLVFKDQSVQQISDNEGKTARYFLICSMQNDYMRKDVLRLESIVQFRNAVLLLCEIYTHIKIANGNPIKILELPLLDYMEMLLETHSADDIKIFTDQIAVVGKTLYNEYQERIDQLMLSSRQILIKEHLSTGSRQMLLYAVDLANQKFNPLPSALQKFYEQHRRSPTPCQNNDLPNIAAINIDNAAVTIPDSGKSNVDAKGSLNSDIESIGKALRTPLLEGTMKSESSEQHISQRFYSASSNNRALRAIRGSGATDVGKEPRIHVKTNLTSTPKASSNIKGWGHDDRFEKDYE